ncbi:hypothetical protein J6590_000210 [Homalodisca vitripennis]|nr:hypothetical protein J6590_000210 [Homalodisca vitripennis]
MQTTRGAEGREALPTAHLITGLARSAPGICQPCRALGHGPPTLPTKSQDWRPRSNGVIHIYAAMVRSQPHSLFGHLDRDAVINIAEIVRGTISHTLKYTITFYDKGLVGVGRSSIDHRQPATPVPECRLYKLRSCVSGTDITQAHCVSG